MQLIYKRKIILTLTLLLCISGGVQAQFSPNNFSPLFWLDGEDVNGNGSNPSNGATVTQWTDKSGNGRHASTGTGTVTYNASNEGLDFDGSSNLDFSSDYYATKGSFTVIGVWEGTGQFFGNQGTAGNRMYLWHDGIQVGTNKATGAAISGQSLVVYQANSNTDVQVVFTNGSSTANSGTGTWTDINSNQRVGGVNTPMNGSAYEMLAFNYYLGSGIRQELEGYLAHKWNLTLSLPLGHKYGSQSYDVAEYASNDSPVVTMPVNTVESSSTWSIVSGNTNSAFSINSSNGLVTVANSSELVPGRTFVLGIQINDGVNTSLRNLTLAIQSTATENCTNGVDDDGDGFIDCDDLDCFGFIPCFIVGGGDGGLESNGDLAAKIGKRDYERAVNNISFEDKTKLPRLERAADYGKPNELSFRDDYEINDFIPIDVLPGSETFITSPADLVSLTNAIQVASVDVYEGESRTGVVLATKSEEGVYEHSKYICDRVKGASINRIFTHQFDDQHEFIVTFFSNNAGGNEYTSNFSAFVNDNGDFVLESHWNLSAYTENKTFYNFQVWSNSMSRLELLVDEIIDLLKVKSPVATYNFSGAPQVYAKTVNYDNENIILEMVNEPGASKVRFKGSLLEDESKDREDFEYNIELNGEREQLIKIPTGGLYNYGADIVYDEAIPADQIFTSDGFWGMAFQQEHTTVDSWEVSKSDHATFNDARWIERNFHLKGETSNYITVYRSLNPAFRSEDFSDFNTLTFELEGSGAIEITIIKEGIEKISDQMQVTYYLEGSCKRVYLHKEDFANSQEWDDVKMIYFTQRTDDPNEKKAFDFQINNVAFVNLEEKPNCNDYNLVEFTVFPNPVNDHFNMHFSLGNLPYDLVLSNQVGQVVLQQTGLIPDNGTLLIDQKFAPGIYFYQVKLESGEYSGKILVSQE